MAKNSFKGWENHPQVKPQIKKVKKENKYIAAICQALEREGIEYIAEHRFDKDRKWRFDVFVPKYSIGIEYNGGQWTGGRHTLGYGYSKDLDKINRAQILGHIVLQYTTNHFSKQYGGAVQVIADVREIIKRRAPIL